MITLIERIKNWIYEKRRDRQRQPEIVPLENDSIKNWKTIKIVEMIELPIIKPISFVAEYIVLHHSLTKDNITVNWNAITRFHLAQGWSWNGYHFGIERIGEEYKIMAGRPMDYEGAHAKEGGMNKKSVGICMIGNFDLEPPPEKQMFLAMMLVKKIQSVCGIQNKNIIGHREAQAIGGVPADKRKTCPGLKFSILDFKRNLAKIS